MRNGRNYYESRDSNQVFILRDSSYDVRSEYNPLVESLSFPVTTKIVLERVRNGRTSRLLGALLADRKSEIRYRKSMGDSERERIRKEIDDISEMSKRVGSDESVLVNMFASFMVSSDHPVKLRESSGTFRSIMGLMGFVLDIVDYITSKKMKKIISPFQSPASAYLADTLSVTSLLPVVSARKPSTRGVIIGADDMTEKPVISDIFGKSSYNCLVFGETGSGKSFFSKIFLMRYISKGEVSEVHVLDPLNEYSCDLFGEDCAEISLDDANTETLMNSATVGSRVTIYKISDLIGKVKSSDVTSVVSTLYSHMIRNDSRKLIVIDEAHMIINEKRSLEILSRMIRHSRHYHTSVMCITQNVDDLSKSQFSSVIAENSSSIFIFRTRSIAQSDKNRFGLNSFGDVRTETLMGGKKSPYSECLMLEGKKLRKVRVISTEYELRLVDGE